MQAFSYLLQLLSMLVGRAVPDAGGTWDPWGIPETDAGSIWDPNGNA
jgi:hypothetical protein